MQHNLVLGAPFAGILAIGLAALVGFAPGAPTLDERAKIGIAEFAAGWDKAGARTLADVLQRDPGHPGALVGMSMSALKAGNESDAERLLAQALTRDPGNFDAHMALAFIFNRRNDLGRAQSEFEAAHKTAPGVSGPVFNLAVLASRQGDSTKALGFYREYLKLEPAGEDRPEVERRIAALEAKLGTTK